MDGYRDTVKTVLSETRT